MAFIVRKEDQNTRILSAQLYKYDNEQLIEVSWINKVINDLF